jgi:hypothetical protein
MKQLNITTWFSNAPESKDGLTKYLEELRKKYPASSMVSFVYLKLLFEKNRQAYEKMKPSCFSTIVNKRLFYEYEISPAENFEKIEENEETTVVIGELITKFSDNPPKIGANTEELVLDANFGKQSLKEDPELISETLANIYAEQGYLGKAEKIFKKLALIYPEKNVYFAAQIEKLKNIENNQ